MKLTELFIADLQRDAEATRHVLERVPEGRNSWKPHEKSMELGYLTSLVATMAGWVEFMVNTDEFDIAPVNGPAYQWPRFESRSQILQVHEECLKKAVAALNGATDQHLQKPWKFVARGKVLSELPRHINIRDSVINHLAHHRGQLTVYLRLTSASVPAIYGPSADEGKAMVFGTSSSEVTNQLNNSPLPSVHAMRLMSDTGDTSTVTQPRQSERSISAV